MLEYWKIMSKFAFGLIAHFSICLVYFMHLDPQNVNRHVNKECKIRFIEPFWLIVFFVASSSSSSWSSFIQFCCLMHLFFYYRRIEEKTSGSAALMAMIGTETKWNIKTSTFRPRLHSTRHNYIEFLRMQRFCANICNIVNCLKFALRFSVNMWLYLIS